MALNRTLSQQLIQNSQPSYSPALLALRRWLQGFAKQCTIGIVAFLVLVNLGMRSQAAPSVAIVAHGSLAMGVSEPRLSLSEPFKHQQSRASEGASSARVHRSDGTSAPASAVSYPGLEAYTTQYQLTRARLLLPTRPESNESNVSNASEDYLKEYADSHEPSHKSQDVALVE